MSQDCNALAMLLPLGIAAAEAGIVRCMLSGILSSSISPYLIQYTTSDFLAGRADQLSCLTAADVYRYMAQKHHATIMGVLLAMAAAKAGTIDPIVSKMLCTHAASSLSCYWC